MEKENIELGWVWMMRKDTYLYKGVILLHTYFGVIDPPRTIFVGFNGTSGNQRDRKGRARRRRRRRRRKRREVGIATTVSVSRIWRTIAIPIHDRVVGNTVCITALSMSWGIKSIGIGRKGERIKIPFIKHSNSICIGYPTCGLNHYPEDEFLLLQFLQSSR